MIDLSESRVLIVDDVKANVDVLVEALRGEFKLSVALNGEAALRSAEQVPPDLVLLDIMMPGMDGYEVCRRLRASSHTRDVPVMFLSTLEDVVNKTRGFEAGANDYLTKPFEALEVQARVRSLLKAKAYSDAIKEKLANELRIAREIQLGILPLEVSSCAQGTGLDVHAVMEPALEVGGDLYEVLRAGDDRVVVVVGDVSGKGIPAALFMAVTTTLIRVVGAGLLRPEEILSRVNDFLAAQNPQNLFVTISCAVFDLQSKRVDYASAGHPSPVLLRAGDKPSLPFAATGYPAAIMPGTEITSESLELQSGDSLVFYTDGVTEAFNAQEEQFGERRLTEHLARLPGRSASELVATTLEAVRCHAGDHPQSDDITIVAVRA
ncbi:MAG TPA: SpoIIE family protein phosphatase [Planctomycetaceae bacterium]|jgi:sigma-B regulation protein RsbU (phosphoserine phosphatase)|nr:SpoIIE family protein phosphatase [Planctomycetaceae bacterium]